ncbi:MAG: cyclase family protein, partial [Thermoplasmata archaeon]
MASIAYRRVVDLSQEISPATQMFPAYPQPAFLPWTTREHHGFLTEAMFMVTHTGTHVDAPWHYRPEGKRIHELSPGRFITRCHLLDLRPKRAKSGIRSSEVRSALRVSTFRAGDALLLRTGWEKMRGDHRYLSENPGLDQSGA